ncbi:RNA-binding protein 45 [Diorhabda carinulata]|uniref:RNA-binding protein 45 n=1 Tax=Diorhabda carinulata TaxID=1163345 RepID=UPI0025A0C932|nr:RNA-binding protein 45 [Diorhabda carinulata]XP_057652076.1 RNA-binding protein 45 [Diorhabda carinulata]
MGDKYKRNSSGNEAPHSRLFIIGSKDINEDNIREAFRDFGHIKEVWAVKDRNTGTNKGIFYVQYSKTSEAARALENMKGKFLVNRTIKVMIASSREEGSVKGDDNEEENLKRLFIVVSKSATDNELYDYFKQFGTIEYISIVKDKENQQNKGFAYVKFVKFSDAALALEECDKKYKAVFAQPRKRREEIYKDNRFNQIADQSYNQDVNCPSFKADGIYKFSVIAASNVGQEQLWKLFDLVPSLAYCQFRSSERNRNIYEVVYTNYQWSKYALGKFNGFEYPPRNHLIVKSESNKKTSGFLSNNAPLKRSASPVGPPSSIATAEIMHLAETIAQASTLIEKAGFSPALLQSKLGGIASHSQPDADFCDKPLPPRQPLADIDSKIEARCFVICTPSPLRNSVLQDVFSRFGNLIEVFLLNQKTYGYAKFASRESAEQAIKTLHGVQVLGVRLKVLEADERPDKRQRMEKDIDD